MIALSRRCKVCKRWALSNPHHYEIQDIEKIDSLPMDKVEVIEVKHCGQSAVGTHVAIKIGDTETQYHPLNTVDMPIGGITYSAESVALMDVGSKEQLASWKAHKNSLLEEYWLWLINNGLLNKAINEITQKEFNEAFQTTGVPYKRYLYNESGAQVFRGFNEEEQKRVIISVSESMLTEMIWSMSAMEWPTEDWKKKYGKTRILWPVLFMPINEHLIGMRVSASARLGVNLNDDGSGPLSNKRIIALENTISRCNSQVAKLTDSLSQKNVEIAQLEAKLSETYATNRQLVTTLDKTKAELKTVKCAPSSKSESMKALIREMRDQLRQYEKEDVIEGPAKLEEDRNDQVSKDVAPELSDIKVGIIGGWRRERAEKYPNILTSPGLEDSVGFERVLRESEILVLLTSHVSHGSMWAMKSFVALEQNKPILYTTHLSIPIILDEVASLMKRNQQNM